MTPQLTLSRAEAGHCPGAGQGRWLVGALAWMEGARRPAEQGWQGHAAIMLACVWGCIPALPLTHLPMADDLGQVPHLPESQCLVMKWRP